MQLNLFRLVLGAALMLSAATASQALALPEILLALGESYPLHIEVTLLAIKSKLSDPVEILKGEGLLLLLLTSEPTSSGTFEALFTKVEDEKSQACNSEGDPTGEVLTKGSFHIVYTSLSPLTVGMLLLPAEVKMECGKVKIKIRGSMLASLYGRGNPGATEYAALSSALTGNGSGVPTLTTYYNDTGEAKSAKLESNFGTGYKESAEEIEGEVTAYALQSKMFTITGATVLAILPEILLALGESYPLHIEVTLLAIKSKLSDPVEILKGEGLLLLLLTSEPTSSGTFEALFTKVEDEKSQACNSEGDPTGEVLTKGSFHIVYTSLSPLTVGMLLLPAEVKMECGKVKIKIRGSMLASLYGRGNPGATEYAALSSALTGNGSGVPTLTTYYNDTGEAKSAKLESNFGTGYKESAEEIEGEVTAYALQSKMFTITGATVLAIPPESSKPDISIALGGSYPLHLVVTLLTIRTSLSNPVEILGGEGILLLLLTREKGASGTYELLFTHVRFGAETQCATAGDPAEEELTKGSFRIVYTSLSPLAQILQ